MKLSLRKLVKNVMVSPAICFGFFCFLLTPGQSTHARSNDPAPYIITQPVSQAVEYGADAVFMVTPSAIGPVTFQWLKNGRPLVDYDNTAGSQSSALTIVGAAGNDEGRYSVVVSGAGGSVTSSVVRLQVNPMSLFADNFEQGGGNWRALFDAAGLTLSGAANHTQGGSSGLAMTNTAQKVFHNLPVQYSCRVNFSFWFYDDGLPSSVGGEIRGYSGVGYARYIRPGGLLQAIAIGKYNNPFPSTNTGTFGGQSLDLTKYQGYIMRGTNSGWFNLNAPRSVGWHQMRIDRGTSSANGSDVDFYVDGVLALSVPGVNGVPVDSIFLGSLNGASESASSTVPANAYFDDVAVQVWPGNFDWQNMSTSGPIPDWMKLRETGTNWQTVNLSPLSIRTIAGAQTNGGSVGWAAEHQMIYSTNLRGSLVYTVTTSSDDAYRIEVEGRERNFQMPAVDMPMEVFIDGEHLGRYSLAYGAQSNGFLHCFTPYLRAGKHTVRLRWDNANGYRSVAITAVRLQALVSPNDTSGAMKTWVANRLVAQNGVELCPAASFVSPACIEGRGQFLNMMSIVAGSGNQFFNVPVQNGAGNRWYANVPLSTSNTTSIQTSFQNGGFIQTNEVTWVPLNLLSLETNSVTIRKGDSLLFTAFPNGATNGEVTLSTDGTNSFNFDMTTPMPWQFNQAGVFTVSGAYVPSGATGSLQVTVVDASFDTSPIAWVYHPRVWDCTNLPPGVVIDADPRLRLIQLSDKERASLEQPLPPAVTNERGYRLTIRSGTEPEHYVLARLGTNGPVLANVAVRGFRWAISPETYLRVIDTNPDGSQLIETAFVAAPLYPSLSVQVQIISSGVTFDDGTVTKTLTAQDFDDTGVSKVRFIRPAAAKGSTCHTTHIYDNGALIGWR